MFCLHLLEDKKKSKNEMLRELICHILMPGGA
jgi:hypothetical protein